MLEFYTSYKIFGSFLNVKNLCLKNGAITVNKNCDIYTRIKCRINYIVVYDDVQIRYFKYD